MAGKQWDAFISYAREDEESARRLFEELQQVGLKPWLDKASLRPGERWQPAITKALKGSRYCLLLLSSATVRKVGFIQREIKLALDILAEFPESEIYLIPIRLNECEPEYEQLRELHWVDMFPHWEPGLERILHEVCPTNACEVELTEMLKISGSTFVMGDKDTGQFKATVSVFMMGKYQVTQALYQRGMTENPSGFKGGNLPVEEVTWYDAVSFCNRLSEVQGIASAYKIDGETVTWIDGSNGYRLPTEAEWEYACRAGTTGDRYGELDEIAWYSGNSKGTTHDVGQKDHNRFGLYDMLGNVWEWCWDWYDGYPAGTATNPRGPEQGSSRVIRGGSWGNDAILCRSARRGNARPGFRSHFLGFRLVRSVLLP